MREWEPLFDSAWDMYRRLEDEPFLVKPSIPILFFGDSEKYFQSECKIITVGLNPSLIEFPASNPFLRFAAAEEISDAADRKTFDSLYLQALNGYFKNEPYRRWFDPSFERLLNGMDCSYYQDHGYANNALHTDICSPLATTPTWSGLSPLQRVRLEAEGAQLWHDLVEHLAPDIIVISVARHHLQKLRFALLVEEKVIHTLVNQRNGLPRKRPYDVHMRTVKFASGKSSHIVFGQAADTPFGTVSSDDKVVIGQKIRRCIGGA